MSVFSNSAAHAAEQGRAYAAALRGLVGDRDPLTALRETPAALRLGLDGFAASDATRAEAPGKWSARDVVQHLADAEIAWAWRLRLILGHDHPTLTPWDQDRWASGLRYADADARAALDEFATVRASNLRLIERVGDAALDRVGIHAEWGEVSARDMLGIEAGHDLLHLAQLERIRRAVGGAPSAEPR